LRWIDVAVDCRGLGGDARTGRFYGSHATKNSFVGGDDNSTKIRVALGSKLG
jgi:hypothetical protein